MIVESCIQGEDRWFKLRTGIPTASNFDKIVTIKGEPSKQRAKYMFQLAGEKLINNKEESYSNHHMQRGVELESEARQLYELVKDVEVKEVGICFLDDMMDVGASPDGLVGKNGGLEIKCPSLPVATEYLLTPSKLVSTYFQQIQGQMYVTGREWCDIMSYYPSMPINIVRVERDNVFIDKLSKELLKFNNELNELVEKLK